MPGRILRKHNVVDKNKNQYAIVDFQDLSKHQIEELIDICETKIEKYIAQRGDSIWKHRRINRNEIPGTVRYNVLKRAKFRCELCGISANERALEVDHIVPVNKNGANAIENYQALCIACNSSKGDTDDEDFRKNPNFFSTKDLNCIFCNINEGRVLFKNHLFYAIEDKYPITEGHTLIIPKRHFKDYFDITQPELNSLNSAMNHIKRLLLEKDKSISGFNIGINSGQDAGQTIFHTHIHLVPRRMGDVTNPKGGVRNLIPGKGDYTTNR